MERFSRLGPDELLYRFTLSDPLAFTAPVEGEMSLHRIHGRLFESACHEGNYSLANMLAGARRTDRTSDATVPARPTSH